MMMTAEGRAIVRLIDHTYLLTEKEGADRAAQEAAVTTLVREAGAAGCHAVCVRPAWLRLAKDVCRAHAWPLRLATVIGFPDGAASTTAQKADAIAQARRDGADEHDVVLNMADVHAGRWRAVTAEIAALCDVAGAQTVKVIFETCLMDADQRARAADAVAEAFAPGLRHGATRFFKTSTGFAQRPGGGPSGATVDDMRAFRAHWLSGIAVKASGGVQAAEDVLHLWHALSDHAAIAEASPERFRIGASSLLKRLQGANAASGAY